MPPPIPRASLRSLSSNLTTSLPTLSQPIRAFSTTTSRQEIRIPPESPRYISIPEPPQSSERKLPPIKGVLPVPREIFHRRNNGNRKPQAGFVDQTVPRSKAEQAGRGPKSEKDAWRRQMAESRRQSLEQGIEGLWRRKQQRAQRNRMRMEANLAVHRAAASAPEPLDDVLTRSTIRLHTLETKVIKDPLWAERQRESAARTAAIQKAASEARKDALQELYIAAGEFIVTEEELNQKIDDLFTEDYFEKSGSSTFGVDGWGKPQNVWEAQGTPITVKNLFMGMTRASNNAIQSYETDYDRTVKRQKTVSEDLTGGKMV